MVPAVPLPLPLCGLPNWLYAHSSLRHRVRDSQTSKQPERRENLDNSIAEADKCLELLGKVAQCLPLQPICAVHDSDTQTWTSHVYATEEVDRVPHECLKDLARVISRYAVDIENEVLHHRREFLYTINVIIVQKAIHTSIKIYISDGKSNGAFRI